VDNNNAGNTRPTDGLTVSVYRKIASDADYTLLVTVTIPHRNSNTWHLTLRNLPRYDGNGATYEYLARETIPAGYTVTYEDNGFTMVNTYPFTEDSPTPIATLTPTPAATTTPHTPTDVEYIDGKWVYIDENGVPLGALPQTGDETNEVLIGAAIALPLLIAGFAMWMVFRRKRKAHAK
jgi:LPXTG-motif cell wall-anchored protein